MGIVELTTTFGGRSAVVRLVSIDKGAQQSRLFVKTKIKICKLQALIDQSLVLLLVDVKTILTSEMLPAVAKRAH